MTTKFRIVEVRKIDGKREYYVEQLRFFFLWSRTYYFRSGFVSYSSGFSTLEEAQKVLSFRMDDTLRKRADSWWNKTTAVVKEVLL